MFLKHCRDRVLVRQYPAKGQAHKKRLVLETGYHFQLELEFNCFRTLLQLETSTGKGGLVPNVVGHTVRVLLTC